MKSTNGVGIHGIGVYLPPEVRQSSWWPEAVIAAWRREANEEMRRALRDDPGAAGAGMPEGARRVIEARAALRDDTFGGAVERRIMPEGMSTSEMETAAAREAIAASGISGADIDLVLSYSCCPDDLDWPSACATHFHLGLPAGCFTTAVEGGANSFLQQLVIAEAMIAAGRARYALLIQSSATSRLVRWEEQSSLFFGDGASAVVVGPVAPGKGVLGRAHRTSGEVRRSIVCGVPGRQWYEEGRIVMYMADAGQTRQMLLNIPDYAKQVIGEALLEAGVRAEDVGFYAAHQGMPWMRAVTQEHAGLQNARSVDTFASTASVQACNVPLMLAGGQREGLLRDGDIVAMFSGGSGMTWSALVMRWGK
ncbi:MAG: hypothetical protein IT372_20600 [Polyangiaceae bacterium]|nr:hypothetical protein [Polyangiaceae bacterium]